MTVVAAGQKTATWASSTTNVSALQDAVGSSRIASCYYSSTSFSVDIDLIDGQAHDLALFFVDWDTTSRAETVTLSDAVTGTVLSTESISSFHSGVYLQWAVSGNVLITFTRVAGLNAVLSGIFLDPSTVPTSNVVVNTTESTATTTGQGTGASATAAADVPDQLGLSTTLSHNVPATHDATSLTVAPAPISASPLTIVDMALVSVIQDDDDTLSRLGSDMRLL